VGALVYFVHDDYIWREVYVRALVYFVGSTKLYYG
jgi:hypothetical protein